jgi:stage III sporulation protein SpoIIIAA
MECKHQYYKYVNGILVCTGCGNPVEEIKKKPAIEDKMGTRAENKSSKTSKRR